jgi:LysM repeat protein
MTPLLIARIVAPAVALVAAGGAALVFGVPYVQHGQPFDAAPPASSASSQPAPAARNETAATPAPSSEAAKPAVEGLSATKTEVAGLGAALAGPSARSAADQSGPAFDLARIEPSGDAVIAGRAAPGANVELMRNGERLDGAVADASGQFVIVPPRLPGGEYQLTLRAKSPDGSVLSSKQGVAVNIKQPPAPIKQAEASPSAERSSGGDVQKSTSAPPSPRLQAASQAADASPRTALANAAPDEAAPAREAAPRGTRVVARGDSLWRISRITYGAGQQYAIVYRANRNQIRNPNIIHPGQVLVLPVKQR